MRTIIAARPKYRLRITAPTLAAAPDLAMDVSWDSSQNIPHFSLENAAAIGAGYGYQIQIQATGQSWGSPTQDITHTITSDEDTADSFSFGFTLLPNATYDARVRSIDLSSVPSAWSTAVTFTVNLVQAPVNTILPSLSGDPSTSGNVLTVDHGTWTGTAPMTFAYQWKKNGTNISGATASTYTLVSGDVGATVTCVVTATNSQGSASATGRLPAIFTYVGGFGTQSGYDDIGTQPDNSSTTLDIGPASADRYVGVIVTNQNGRDVSGVTINGISASIHQDVNEPSSGSYGAELWGGIVDTGDGIATIVVNFTGGTSYTTRQIHVFTGRRMSNTSGPVVVINPSTRQSSVSVAVQKGDFLLVAAPENSTITFGGSTVAPTDVLGDPISAAPHFTGADWKIANDNAAFQIIPSANTFLVGAVYR